MSVVVTMTGVAFLWVATAAAVGGVTGALGFALAYAVWLSGPSTEGQTFGERRDIAYERLRQVRRLRAREGKTDPWPRIAYRTDDVRRELGRPAEPEGAA